MKRAKQRKVKPRNPLVAVVVQKRAGAHQRHDKRASRAQQKAALQREGTSE
jgi:hypothetical protein